MYQDTVVLGGDWSSDLVIDGSCSLDVVRDGSANVITAIKGGYPVYAGPFEIAPAAEEQVIQMAGCVVPEDIKVGAIPSNYGLITWDGATLTVS